MYRYQLYKVEDIEKLKQELELCQHTLELLQSNEIKDDSLIRKSGLNHSKIEGEVKNMEEKIQSEAEYEQKDNDISAKINRIDESISQLRQDMNDISNKVEQKYVIELLERMNDMLEKQSNMLKEGKSEIDQLEEAIFQLKDHGSSSKQEPKINNEHSPQGESEYRKLQSMLRSPKHVEPVSNNKKKSLMATRRMKQSISKEGKIYPNNAPRNVQHKVSMNRKQGEDRKDQYELNKTIITNVSTSKNNQEEEEPSNEMQNKETLISDEHSPVLDDGQSMEELETNRTASHSETNPEKSTDKEESPPNETSNKDEENSQNLSSYSHKANETANEQQSNEEHEDIQQEKENANNKNKLSSFFSYFKDS